MRVNIYTRGPGGAGLREGLPLSPESLWGLGRAGYVGREPPAADLWGRGRGGHIGGHRAAAAAEALGGLQPGEHGQRVWEVGGRRWRVGWGAHLGGRGTEGEMREEGKERVISILSEVEKTLQENKASYFSHFMSRKEKRVICSCGMCPSELSAMSAGDERRRNSKPTYREQKLLRY